ncbi:MAG: D-glycero-beta-D-manno-heptose 1-phosphate adenylyltransferase [Chitinispirillales bacterium]|jgi:glycerol-3-phosphate cytidylyltransferase|nr:D-glycero-beta-D-manno-heptose 1-phosphate adenylyltransferase [Chitinispirillales bacterium]
MENIFKKTYELSKFIDGVRLQNKKIVSTNGCFDILHRGHIRYLNDTAKLGDVLVVGINSDKSVRSLKGENRPIQSEDDRAYILVSLKAVDAVFIFDELTPYGFIEVVKPDIHTKGGDYEIENLPETKIVEKYGGSVKILKFFDGYSTTKIVQKLNGD